MTAMEPQANTDAIAVASGAVVTAILDTLLAKEVLTNADVRDLLNAARDSLAGRAKNNLTLEANHILGSLFEAEPRQSRVTVLLTDPQSRLPVAGAEAT